MLDWTVVRLIVKIGVPAGLQVVMVSLAEVAVLSFVNHYGSNAVAAYGAVNQVVNYIQFPAISLSIAASIFGAQAIGARSFHRIGEIVRAAVILNYIIVGTLIVLGYALDKPLLSLFLGDSPTVGIARGLLDITLWSYVIFGNAAVLSGVMRASGTVLWPTMISVFTIWAVEVPIAWVLSSRIGLNGVWVGYPAAYCVMLALQSAYYFRVWKRRELRALA
jgi:Na+-driven multidrug efflux pump